MATTGSTNQILPSNRLPFEVILDALDLSGQHKVALIHRYVSLTKEMRSRAFRLSILFNSSRVIITVGSLVVPALLSIQYTNTTGSGVSSASEQSMRIYWITWFVSLLVTMCNGLATLFKLDKRFYFVHTTLEQLISEGWQFAELTGKYSGFYTPHVHPTHENQFIYFCHAVEKIRMRQVEEEYVKLSELHGTISGGGGATVGAAAGGALPVADAATATAANTNAIVASRQAVPTLLSSLIPPTPLKGELDKIPAELLALLRGGGGSAGAQQLSHADLESGHGATGTTEGVKSPENKETYENR